MIKAEKKELEAINADENDAVNLVQKDDEEIPVVELDYDKYQVVRGEFFAHLREPSITFNNNKISLNAACINRLPEIEYIQILINPDDKKLAVRPSREDEKDSFVWITKGMKRQPKQITCRVFFAKIMEIMGWNPDYKYKLLGKLVRSDDELLFAFDLNEMQTYPRIKTEGERPRTSRTPVFPIEWEKPFGLSVEEHRKRLQVNIFKGYAVFSVNENSAEGAEQTIIKEGKS